MWKLSHHVLFKERNLCPRIHQGLGPRKCLEVLLSSSAFRVGLHSPDVTQAMWSNNVGDISSLRRPKVLRWSTSQIFSAGTRLWLGRTDAHIFATWATWLWCLISLETVWWQRDIASRWVCQAWFDWFVSLCAADSMSCKCFTYVKIQQISTNSPFFTF